MSSHKVGQVIPLSVPEVRGNEWKYIKECLDTGWVSSVGAYVNMFEDKVKGYLGSEYAIAVVNGTSALHVSLLACGVQNGDEVIVPTLTFVATANAVRYCGAHPVFMDCEPDTLCIDTQKVTDFLDKECRRRRDGHTYNRQSGRRVKAIIPVHVFGHPADMDALIDICGKNKIDVIEDATESLGSEYHGKKTGSLGKTGCLSFNGNKIITTGGGGMVVTGDAAIAAKIRHLTTQARSDPFEYDHDDIGYNYRLTNIQAAMGMAQMERIDEYITIKRKNASLYSKLLSGLEGVEFLWEKPWARSNFWFYTIKVPMKHKKPLMEHLISKNIQVRPVWKLIHTLPMYRDLQAYAIEKAQEAYNSCINLPCSVGLKEEEIRFVGEQINSYFNKHLI